LKERTSNPSFDISKTFANSLGMGLSSNFQNFKPMNLILIKKKSNSKTLKCSLKTWYNSMHTIYIPQGLKFYRYKVLKQVQIEGCEDIQVYNKFKLKILKLSSFIKKLKLIMYLKSLTYLLIF
jgi:hypothetical protein